jgi:hypothetical protein
MSLGGEEDNDMNENCYEYYRLTSVLKPYFKGVLLMIEVEQSHKSDSSFVPRVTR